MDFCRFFGFYGFNHGGNRGQMVHILKFGSPRTACSTAVVYFLPAVVQLSSVHPRNRFPRYTRAASATRLLANSAHGGNSE